MFLVVEFREIVCYIVWISKRTNEQTNRYKALQNRTSNEASQDETNVFIVNVNASEKLKVFFFLSFFLLFSFHCTLFGVVCYCCPSSFKSSLHTLMYEEEKLIKEKKERRNMRECTRVFACYCNRE